MKIVFFGDSVTDACKDRSKESWYYSIGQGYPNFVAAYLSSKDPLKYEFVNSGIGGDNVEKLYARVKSDVWSHNPDMVSILIGINDSYHKFLYPNKNEGIGIDRFKTVYRSLIEDTRKALPNVKIMLLGPYAVRYLKTDFDWYDEFAGEIRERSRIVSELAEEFDLVYVPLQEKLDQAIAGNKVSVWIADGLHPAPAGRLLIAKAWLEAFEKNYET